MDNNVASKIWVGMSTTNIHLLQFKIQSHLQKRGLWMPVHQNSFRRKKHLKFLTLHLPFCLFLMKILHLKLIAILRDHSQTLVRGVADANFYRKNFFGLPHPHLKKISPSFLPWNYGSTPPHTHTKHVNSIFYRKILHQSPLTSFRERGSCLILTMKPSDALQNGSL